MSGVRPQPRDELRALSGYHSPQLDVDVRLNTNESPFAVPEALRGRLRDAIDGINWHRYPDRAATELRAAIGRRLGQSPARVFAANGSNEVLQTILLTYGGAGRTVLVFEPTYALHSHIARLAGCTVALAARADDFSIDADDAVERIAAQRPSVVFVCSPNNPTGTVESRSTVTRLADACSEVGSLLVVDEAYGEFADWTAIDLVDESRPVVVARTFSKVWSMAGVRLGYCIAPQWCVEELEKVVLPYHLSSSTQVVGTISLEYETEMDQRVAALVEERGRMFRALSEFAGIDVVPSGANFLLVRIHGDGHAVWEAMVDQGVLIRDFSRWPGVEDCLRITIGTPTENDRCLEALRGALIKVGIG